MGKSAARNYFFEEIGKKMETEDIYIVSADLAGPPFDFIREKYANRYVPVGIAEQNLISVACGIALTGKKVIAYTSNPFIAFRAFDQVRNAAALMGIPLAIVGVGTGFSISAYGTTHFITEDISMMSLCPGLKTITVSDMKVAQKALEYVLGNDHLPCYIRFDKDCDDNLTENDFNLKNGWRYIKQSASKTLVISQGYTSHIANSADFGNEAPSIIDIVANPFDEKSFVDEIQKYEKIIVIEEQQLRGGLGSIILEILNNYGIYKPLKRLGIDYGDEFPEFYASRDYLTKYFGIDSEALTDTIKTFR